MPSAQKITVIGGSGFVGTHFCERLYQRQIPFEIIDLKQSKRFPEKTKIADIRDLVALKSAITGGVIVHLAAVHRDDVRNKNEYYTTNVQGTENIATVCKEKSIQRIVFASSVAVYGIPEGEADEDSAINPINDYGKSKFQGEEILRSWQNKNDGQLLIVRPTVIFGEGNRGNVYNLFRQIVGKKFAMIGRGGNKKSMAYIANVAAFLDQCVEADVTYDVYNYVDGPDVDMNTLVRLVREEVIGASGIGFRIPFWLGLLLGHLADAFSRVTSIRLPVSALRVKKFCSSTVFSSKKDELGDFCPPYTLRQGIERTLNAEFINPNPDREVYYTE